jgi:hypothetical protein
MSQQVAANSQKLYTQTLPITSQAVTLGGMWLPAIDATIKYVVDGSMVTLVLPETIVASTNPSSVISFGTLPQALWPRADQNIPCVTHIGVNSVLGFVKITAAGVMTMTSTSTSSPPGLAGFESQTINYPIA